MNTATSSRRVSLLLAVSMLFAFAGTVSATLHVATIGDDTMGDGSPGAPFKTIQRAYNRLTFQGETILVAPGIYNECVNLSGQLIEVGPGEFVRKWAVVQAQDPNPAFTVIDGGTTCTPITFGGLKSGSQASTLQGFTVRNGNPSAIVAFGSAIIRDNVIQNSTAFDDDGGGIRYISNTCLYGESDLTISGNTLTNNTADRNGGGIGISAGVGTGRCQTSDITVLIEDNTLENNTADDDGGGIHLEATPLPGRTVDATIRNNTVQNNHAIGSTSLGGGILVEATGPDDDGNSLAGTATIRVLGNIVDNNDAVHDGGGIHGSILSDLEGDYLLIIDDNTVTDNTVDRNGGGIAVLSRLDAMIAGEQYDVFVTNNLIEGNASGDGTFGGGGIFFKIESFDGTTFDDALSSQHRITGNIITDNTTLLVGGGISASVEANIDSDEIDGCDLLSLAPATAHLAIENNLITGNGAIDTGGGVAAFVQGCFSSGDSSTIRLLLNTIADNQTPTEIGGVQTRYFSTNGAFTGVEISHTIISNNFGTGLGGDFPIGNTSLQINYSNVIDNTGPEFSPWITNPVGSDGNIQVAPGYINRVAGDFHLSSSSALIDAGAQLPGFLPPFDIDRNPRVADGDGDLVPTVDIGADEYFVCTDVDGDGFGDPILAGDDCEADNCPSDFNPGQADCDMDLIGDACDNDAVDGDGDGVAAACDSDDSDPFACGDLDNDTCEDCSSGFADPSNDGPDGDFDGICDAGDPDLDGDGVDDVDDSAPTNPFLCRDFDEDTCEDCVSGISNPSNDGPDFDGDGLCNAGDPDDDNDNVPDTQDQAPLNQFFCRDLDLDGCNDCTSGTDDVSNDGPDADSDGDCDNADTDDDNDGIDDGFDPGPLDPNVCGDSDADLCDDCTNGVDGFGPLPDSTPGADGLDTDADGACDAGDPDDDNDGVSDDTDASPIDPDVCGDSDSDTCDDCTIGTDDFGMLSDSDVSNDGPDFDGDGACDAGDPDDDNDGIDDGTDSDPLDPFLCADTDQDSCDDCSGGTGVLVEADFDGDARGFSYQDDTFRGTNEPAYSDGVYDPISGFDNGALRVSIGGVNGDDIVGMSGGWSQDFILTEASEVTVSFRYNLTTSGRYETDEYCDVLFSVDAGLIGVGPNDYIARIVGDGNDGSEQTTGWQQIDIELGQVPAGPHSIVLGAFNNKKTFNDEFMNVLFDDVFVSLGGGVGFDPSADGPDFDADGLCDAGDADDDDDGVDDGDDSDPLDPRVCRDVDGDSCDDCSNGTEDASNDGPDPDSDGICDLTDTDDDNDGVDDAEDPERQNPFICGDVDEDTCDDCSVGTDGFGPLADGDVDNDGIDTDSDGQCNAGDDDDDNDGVADEADPDAQNPDVCGDSDNDTCDDCINGTDDLGPASDVMPGNDGVDLDEDGLCDAGDPDDDNDGVADGADPAPQNPDICGDSDNDTCDDCTNGTDDLGPASDATPGNDGIDFDADGLCDAGDPDDDNDGVDDGSDCAPLINSISSPAGQIGPSLRFGSDGQSLRWLAIRDANVYNVYRGTVSSGALFTYNHSCFATEVEHQSVSDAAEPDSAGDLQYYLISATNTCDGDGGVGSDSAGTPRPVTSCTPLGSDGDADGILDINDNCPSAQNTPQLDVDLDGRGDSCDNCSGTPNLDQADADVDGTGNICDDCTDIDDDGFGDPNFLSNTCHLDNCPLTANDQTDGDGDLIGDACDICAADFDNDSDGDGFCADEDNCPDEFNLGQSDGDFDGLGDACDPCVANGDALCVACPDGSDPDGDGFCQIGTLAASEGLAMDYLRNDVDPGIGLDWVEDGYVLDGSWAPGVYGIGYDTTGSSNNAQDLITTGVRPGVRSIYTVLTFDVVDPGDLVRVLVGADYDDGYAVWINGNEIFRSPELPTGTIEWDSFTFANESSNGSSPDYGELNNVTAAAQAAMQPGSNTLAIGVWNASAGSSDLVLVPLVSIETSVDNCPGVANPGQEDTDGDGIGDACDSN